MDERVPQDNLIEHILNYFSSENDIDETFADPLYKQTALEFVRFIDEIPGGFLIYKAYGNEEIIYANKALIKIFRCSTLQEFREFTGNTFRGVVLPVDLDAVENSIQRQITGSVDQMDFVEYRIRRRDGQIRWVEDYGHFIHSDAVGDIFYVFVSDVTEEKNRRIEETAALMNEKEHRIQTLIEEYDKERKLINQEHLRRLEVIEGLSVNYDTILYVDIDSDKVLPYRVSYRAEKEFEEMYQPRAFTPYIRKYVSDWVCEEDRDVIIRATDGKYIKRKLEKSKTFFVNYRIAEDGVIRHMQLRVVNVGSERRVSQVVIGSRNIEEEIRRDIKQMKILEEALNNAKLANVAKNTFLSNMSHDMRTPLNAIFGYTTLAKNCVDEAARVYLDKIDVAAKQLLELIDKVLEISQIESSEVVLANEECNIGDIVNKAFESVKAQADEKKISVVTDFSEVARKNVIADSDKLEQALSHIVNNAVKYTGDGGNVSVSVKETKQLPNGYSVYSFDVADNGIGISAEALPHIFEPFERVKNTTSSGVYGTGLGLTIAKRYIEAMDGRITVASEEGKGSKFTITLNLQVSDKNESLVATAEDLINGLCGRKILLVDDNEINLEIEQEILEDLGFSIVTAADGSEAVEKLRNARKEEYALVLMDIQMPVMDGRRATEEIRKLSDKETASIPIIALSANAFESDRKLSLESGMDEHLTKPIDIPVLLKTIAAVFRSRGK